MLQIQYVISTVYAMIMIYNWINLIEQLPIYSTLSYNVYVSWNYLCASSVHGEVLPSHVVKEVAGIDYVGRGRGSYWRLPVGPSQYFFYFFIN